LGQRRSWSAEARETKIVLSTSAMMLIKPSDYLKSRSSSRVKEVFLVSKDSIEGHPSRFGDPEAHRVLCSTGGLSISCHHLRHTMATQLLNADADLVTIQDLLDTHGSGHQRYARVSNLKVQRDYYKAMELILQQTIQEDIGRVSISRQ